MPHKRTDFSIDRGEDGAAIAQGATEGVPLEDGFDRPAASASADHPHLDTAGVGAPDRVG